MSGLIFSSRTGAVGDSSDGENLTIKMINKDPSQISSFLHFLSKKLDKFVDTDNKDDYEETKAILGIETMEGDDKVMFYLVNCEKLDDLSLLEYIDSQNGRLSSQREELIDLSVRIANLNHNNDTEKAMEEVINHYKSGLASGVGLRDMITQIKERYPWPSSTKITMILASLITCLLGIGLYFFDLLTDIKFSLEMLNRTVGEDSSNQPASFRHFLHQNVLTFSSCESYTLDCWQEMTTSFDEIIDERQKVNITIMDVDFQLTGWFSVWHCIQPFVASLLLILGMNFNKSWGRSEKACYLLVPIPVITYLRCFYFNIRNFWSKNALYFFTFETIL